MLLTNPITVNDGSSDHIFNFVSTVNVGKSIVSTWKESLDDNSQISEIVVKYDPSSKTRMRSVIQYRSSKLMNDGVTYDTVITNFSINHHREHQVSDVVLDQTLVKAAISVAGVFDTLARQG